MKCRSNWLYVVKFTQIVLTALSFIVPTAAQEVGFLDMTQVQIRYRVRVTRSVGIIGGVMGHSKPLPPTMRIKLESLDRREYTIGETLLFEVKLENVSQDRVRIPWNPHPADIEPDDPAQLYEYTNGQFSLSGEDEHGETVHLSGISLYGSPKVPGSLLELSPGNWVRIRAKIKLYVGETQWGKQLLSRGESELALKVSFSTSRTVVTPKNGGYDSTRYIEGNRIKSSNSIPFLLKAWKPN